MLDADTAAAVREAIVDTSAGRTLVIAEHRIAPWLDHVDRLVLLGEQARILADGPPHQVAAEMSLSPAAPTAPGPTSAHDPGSGSPPGAEAVARLQGVVAERGGRRVLEGVDLPVQGGQLTVITGPSGAGKTTLLRVLLGLTAVSAGIVSRPQREQVAFVPQNPEHSFVASTVREEVLASPWAEDEQLAQELLERAELTDLAAANPYTLSGGEQRRLAIVAALAQRPRLLVLDEPTVGLDAQRHTAVLELLEAACAEGCAVVAASHDQALIEHADIEHRLTGPTAPTDPAHGWPDRTIGPVPRRRPIPADALNPLVLSLIGILAAIGSFAVQTWQGGLLALLPIVLLAPLTVRSLRGGLLRLTPILLSAAGLAWTTALLGDAPSLSREAWLLGAKEAARITVFVAPGVLALGSVDPTALGDASEAGCGCRPGSSPRRWRAWCEQGIWASSGRSSPSPGCCAASAPRPPHGCWPAPPWHCWSMPCGAPSSRPWRWTRAASPPPPPAPGRWKARCVVSICSGSVSQWRWGSGRCWPNCWWAERLRPRGHGSCGDITSILEP